MDIFVRFKDSFIQLINNLPQSLNSFFLRLGILLLLENIILALSWLKLPNRNTFKQTCIAVLVFIFCLYLPVQKIIHIGGGFSTLMVVLSLLATIFLIQHIPFFITPRYGTQQLLKKIFIGVIIALFILQVIVGG